MGLEVEEAGFKYEMTDLSASLGLVQLAKLESCNEERRRLLGRYREAFREVDGVELLAQKDYTRSACYNAVVKVVARDELMRDIYQGSLGGTYGGNPIACAVALKVLEILRRIEPMHLPAKTVHRDQRNPGRLH